MSVAYWIESEELWSADASAGSILWHGTVEGRAVMKVVAIPSTEDCVALVTWPRPLQGDFQNVLRVHADGTVQWRAPVPTPETEDFYTDISWGVAGLGAYAASGYAVHLDCGTGQIISRVFAK